MKSQTARPRETSSFRRFVASVCFNASLLFTPRPKDMDPFRAGWQPDSATVILRPPTEIYD